MSKLWPPFPRSQRNRNTKRNKYIPLVLEPLEERVVPTNDFYIVPGSPDDVVTLSFIWSSKDAAFRNELGVFIVDDINGTIVGTSPGDDGYAAQVITTGTTVFDRNDNPGAVTTFNSIGGDDINGGDILGFYLIQNASQDTWLASNNTNAVFPAVNSFGRTLAFFSFDGPNPGGFDPVFSNVLGGDPAFKSFHYDDLGGNVDFNDMVFIVRPALPGAVITPSQASEVSLARFIIESNGGANYFNEIGMYVVEDEFGLINGLRPGDEGYIEQALLNRRPLFNPVGGAGSHNTVLMNGETQFGFYATKDGSGADVLANNPFSVLGNGPLVFLNMPGSNPSHQNPFQQLGANRFQVGDVVFSFEFETPILTAALKDDTSGNQGTDEDNISMDSTVTGTITNNGTITSLTASIDSEDDADFQDISNLFDQALGTFEISQSEMDQLAGGTLANGEHTLRLRARSSTGTLGLFELTFTFDTEITFNPDKDATLTLDPAFDSGTPGDNVTSFSTVTLNGVVEPNVLVRLFDSSGTELDSVQSGDSGTYSFNDVALNAAADFTPTDTVLDLTFQDNAGNVDSHSATFTVSAGLGLNRDSDSGVIGDNITNATTVSLDGFVASDSSVELFDDDTNTSLGTTTADSLGNFSFDNIVLNSDADPTVATDTNFRVEFDNGVSSSSFTQTITHFNEAPTVANAISDDTLSLSTAATDLPFIDLAGVFTDPDINNSLVRFVTNNDTSNGTFFDIELLDTVAPRTVANFFNYVNNNDYDDTVFHRRTDPVTENIDVIQGGGFEFVDGPPASIPAVPTGEMVVNEFDPANPNASGTISMARTSDINSATNQFFFNLIDNPGLDNVAADNQFTVFGNIVDNRAVIDDLAAVPTEDFSSSNGAFGSFPIRDSFDSTTETFPDDLVSDDVTLLSDVQILRQVETLTYSVTVTDGTVPGLVTADVDPIQANRVFFTYGSLGTETSDTVTITITATDSGGRTVTESFDLTITDS